MSSYPGIEYFLHDGSVYLVPHYTNESDLATMLNLAREAAQQSMIESRADHAIYGVKYYDSETGVTSKAEIYAPAVLLNDAEFDRRTDSLIKDTPSCLILALHSRR